MIPPPGVSQHETYDAPRGTCPSCDSENVIHLMIGLPAGPDVMNRGPDWVHWVGCTHPGFNRECSSCGATWSEPAGEFPKPIRLPSEAGAAFALLPIPSLQAPLALGEHLIDIELLDPTRLVRYLGRELSANSLLRLGDTLMNAAQDRYPEQSVPTFQATEAGLAVLIDESTPSSVTIEILIDTALDDDMSEKDGLAFDVARSDLIDAAHAVEGWLP